MSKFNGIVHRTDYSNQLKLAKITGSEDGEFFFEMLGIETEIIEPLRKAMKFQRCYRHCAHRFNGASKAKKLRGGDRAA